MTEATARCAHCGAEVSAEQAWNHRCRAMDAHQISDATLALVISLLSELRSAEQRATGAYAMGAICGLAWEQGVEPPPQVLRRAATCTTIAQGAALIREYQQLRKELFGSS